MSQALGLAPSAPVEPEVLAGLLTELAGIPTVWRSLARFDPSGRWWQRVQHDDDVDVWLITWLTGQSTDLHDHGGSAGAFTVLQGALTERRVAPDRRTIIRTTVPQGTSVVISPTAVHDVYNAGPAPAVSLHAYSPPLSQMSFYAQQPTGVTWLKTVDTHDDLDAA